MGTLSHDDSERLRTVLEQAIRRYCPRWLWDSREDIAQAAMVRVLDLWSRSEKDGPPGHAYMARVAFTAIAGEIRRLRSKAEVPLSEEVNPGPASTPRPGPERATMNAELGRAIRDCLRRLSEPRRLAVALHLQGHDRQASATILRWQVKQVDNHKHRGLQDLRRCLSEKGHAP